MEPKGERGGKSVSVRSKRWSVVILTSPFKKAAFHPSTFSFRYKQASERADWHGGRQDSLYLNSVSSNLGMYSSISHTSEQPQVEGYYYCCYYYLLTDVRRRP